MKKEIVENPPSIHLAELISLTEEQWRLKWQDINFTKEFPKQAVEIASPQKRHLFTNDSLKTMVQRSTITLMDISWKTGRSSFAGINFIVDDRLNATAQTEDVAKLASSRESLIRCNFGSLIFLGYCLEDKNFINNLLFNSYEHFGPYKKNGFRSHLLRLLRTDSSLQNFIKKNNLDTSNNFEWNREMAKLLLSLRSSRNSLPVEFSESLCNYPFEAVDEFVNYALDYINTNSKISRTKTDVTEFLLRLGELKEKGYFDNSPLSLDVIKKIEKIKDSVSAKNSN